MFKRYLAALALAATALSPAWGADLGAAFDNLVAPGAAVSVNQPGRFQSAARNTFVAGGADMRFPRRSGVSLISVTPPSLSAGCGGISAHFGGFSFVSGAEIEQLIRSIAQNSTGMVVSLAIKTLCPMCESVIQTMTRLAQQASKMSMDSCAVGTNIANQLADTFGAGPGANDVRRNVCAATETELGGSSDWFQALDGACKTAMGAMKTVEASLAELQSKKKNPDGTAAPISESYATYALGNRTWMVLNALIDDKSDEGLRQRLMLLNLLGTELAGSNASCGMAANEGSGTTVEPNVLACPPRLEAKEAMALFMCGLPGRAADGTATFRDYGFQESRALGAYCNNWFAPETDTAGKPIGGGAWARASQSVKLWNCADGYERCMNMELVPMTEMNLVRGPGFAYQVNRLLREGARRVRANDMALGEGDDGKKLLGLIQAAPYPIYQAINAAAVYPAAADDLLDTMSILVAEMMAYEYFDEFLRLSGRSGNGTRLVNKHLDRVYLAMGELRGQVSERRRLIGQNIALQEALNEQIRSINLAIQRQVLTTDMLNANRFAVSAGNPQAGGNSSPGPTTP
jgi:conjugative transfer pilus assembly protein TraH